MGTQKIFSLKRIITLSIFLLVVLSLFALNVFAESSDDSELYDDEAMNVPMPSPMVAQHQGEMFADQQVRALAQEEFKEHREDIKERVKEHIELAKEQANFAKKQAELARKQAELARKQAERAREMAEKMREKYLQAKTKYVHVKADYEKAKEEWLKIARLKKKAIKEGRSFNNFSDEIVLERAKTFLLKSLDRMISHIDYLMSLVEKENPDNAEELLAKLEEAKTYLDEDIRNRIENAETYEELKDIGKELKKRWDQEQKWLKRATGRTAVKKIVGITNVVDNFANRLDKIREKLQEQGYDTSHLDKILDEIHAKLAQAKTLRERARTAWDDAESSATFNARAKIAHKYILQANQILKELHELVREAVKEIKKIKKDNDNEVENEDEEVTTTTTTIDVTTTTLLGNETSTNSIDTTSTTQETTTTQEITTTTEEK